MTNHEYRSEILTNGLRRDQWQAIEWALSQSGQIGLAKDIRDFIKAKEED
jgi:hypothetical protein